MPDQSPDLFDLVADIGGTNTRVALARNGVLQPDTVTRFRNSEFAGIAAVLQRFLQDHEGAECAGACVAVAGPVQNGTGRLTNLDWEISEAGLVAATQAEGALVLNDLQAQGHGLGHLSDGALKTVLPGPDAADTATQLVIGVGTGFNISPVFQTPAGRFVPPSEAGHVSLPESASRFPGFVETLRGSHGYPAVEDMLSGRGFERTYAHLAGEKRSAAEIMDRVKDRSDPNATEAVRRFVTMLGAVAGDLALLHLPFGGVFLVGGVARAFSPHFDAYGFAENFRDKGRFSEFMDSFSVHVVEDDYAALSGCAAHIHAQR